MPSLTPAQINSCFEILNISRATSGTVDNGFGLVLTLSELDTLKSDIETRLAALDVDAQAKVAALVLQWDLVSTTSMSLQGGSVGNVAGINQDFAMQRALITERLQVYLPVFHLVQAVGRRRGPANPRGPGLSFGRV